MGPHGGPHGPPVGQGRLRSGRAGEVRPARPRHAVRAALRLRPDRPATTASTSIWPPSPRRTRSTTCCARADSVGVFQVESRAQMATLPRLRPRRFYDLVVEVALIRPGPIQGGSVHPYIRRRNGQEPITYLHPLLEPVAGQDPRCAAVPGAADADGHRRRRVHRRRGRPAAPGHGLASGRPERMGSCARLNEGMAGNGITGEVADELWDKIAAFANYGFPESHSVSFAYLVYASAWLKRHYPAAFCAALLNAQPMGFYSPHSLVQDARRHGVVVRTPDLNASDWSATLEVGGPPDDPDFDRAQFLRDDERPVDLGTVGESASTSRVRLGLSSVRSIGDDLARKISPPDVRTASVEDLASVAAQPDRPNLEALATSGAFGCFGDRDGGSMTAAGRCGPPGRQPRSGPTVCRASSLAWMLPGSRAWTSGSVLSLTCGPPAWRPTAIPPASSVTTRPARGRHRRHRPPQLHRRCSQSPSPGSSPIVSVRPLRPA